MSVKAGDVVLVGDGYRLLGLDDFEVVGNTGGEAVLRLLELVVREFYCAGGDFDLIGGGLDV